MGKEDPGLQLHNISNATATNIKWFVLAFDLDNLGQNKQPLPIPAGVFDFLPPNGSNMPINLFDSPTVAPLVKTGHRIFGSVSAMCPTCKRGHTFVFLITLGVGGWYSEEREINDGNVITPSNMYSIEQASEEVIKKTATESRIQIKDSPVRPPPGYR